MLMMARPRRQFSIAQRAKFAAEDLFGDRQAVFGEHPLRQIDQPPAHDFVDRGDGSSLDHGDQRAPLFVIEQARTSCRLAVDEPVWPLGIEPKHPIAKRLKSHTPKPSRFSPRTAIIYSDQSKEATRHRSRFF